MSNATRTFLFLIVLSLSILMFGYWLYEQQGFLVGFIVVLLWLFFVYFYSHHRLNHRFSGREVEGRDPWGLSEMVSQLAKRAGIPPPKLTLLDLPTPTAFSTGRSWDSARIVLTKNLIRVLSAKELQAVLAHEIVHIRALDILSFGISATLAGGAETLAGILDHWFSPRKKPGFFSRLLAPFVLFVVRWTTSPKNDFYADEQAAALTNHEDLARALWKLHSCLLTQPLNVPVSISHLFLINALTSQKPYVNLPPTVEGRIRNLVGHYPC